MFNLILYLKKSYRSEVHLGYFIQNSDEEPFSKQRKERYRWMQKIPIPSANVSVEVTKNTGMIYIFNNDKPMSEPLNIGTLIKNHLFRNSEKLYW